MAGFFRVGLVMALLASNAAFAIKKPAMRNTAETRPRLLSRAEGRSLVDLALEQDVDSRGLDCSHLVHEVLASGGLDYPYATSRELFAGIPQFRRVRNAQPGDLIVWPGHVGLVVSPTQRSFVGTTSAGVRTSAYDSAYWRRRGPPRFYRYVVDGAPVLLAKVSKPSINRNAGSAFIGGESDPNSVDAKRSSGNSSQIDTRNVSSEGVPIATGQRKPTREDVEGAVQELANSGSALESENRTQSPVVLVRQAHIEKLKVKGNEGWADVSVDSRAELDPDGTWKRAAAQKLRCQLVRNDEGWTLLPPADQTYVFEKAAIPVLAKRLSVLLAQPSAENKGQEPADLAALLNVLLNEE